MSKVIFPKEFLWGAATASYQIEGAVYEDDRGTSIWDVFSHTPGMISNGDTGDVACNHYHRFMEDVNLMKEIGLRGYRFSLAWPRIFPEGKGKPNPKGIDFYNFLIDELIRKGIEPAITLYHWDLPQALQDIGGWGRREITDYFADYAAFAFENFGDRVSKWITHNEPAVVAYNGHLFGNHAPGIKNPELALQVAHNLLLSHAKTVQRYRELTPTNLERKGEIGIALNLSPIYPATDSASDREAATIYDGFQNRWFLDPVLRGAYPEDLMRLYGKQSSPVSLPRIDAGDMELMAQNPVDFLGINYYTRSVVRKAAGASFLDFGYEHVRPEGPQTEFTDMDWEVYSQGLYDLLIRISKDYGTHGCGGPRIYITENGAAFRDENIKDGIVMDEDRVKYLKEHFLAAYRAIKDGVKLEGYYVWSFMDNFEWSYGFGKRFGLIRVDYKTLERIWKKSAKWYREVIKNNGF